MNLRGGRRPVLATGRALTRLAATAAIALSAAALVGAWASGWTLQAVRSGSMAPGFPRGSAVVVTPVDPADLDAGTVIAFQDPEHDRLVTHRVDRVIDIDGRRSFSTRGDANAVPDAEPVPARLVRGEVRWRVLGFGSLIQAVQRRSIQVVLAVTPLFLLGISEVAGARQRRRTDQQAQRIRDLEGEVTRLRSAALAVRLDDPVHPVADRQGVDFAAGAGGGESTRVTGALLGSLGDLTRE